MLTSQSPIASGGFGASVSIYGDRALVGEATGAGAGPGHAYIYRRNGTTWALEATLATCDPNVNTAFGSSARLGADVAIVGAPWVSDSGTYETGAAYIFRRHGTDWIQEAKLVSPEPSFYGFFGGSVAIGDRYALVGAPQAPQTNATNASYAGQLFLFEHDPSRNPAWNGVRIAQGQSGNVNSNSSPSNLAWSVGMWGNVAVAGVPTETLNNMDPNNKGSLLVLMRCGTASSCSPALCTAGAASCEGDRATTCAADGQSFDSAGTDCGAAGGTCSAAACVTPACAAGQGTCTGAAASLCRDDGLGTLDLGMCAATDFCTVGPRGCSAPTCHTKLCAPGAAAVCDEESLGMCLADGTGLAAGATDCRATSQVCIAGACGAPLFQERFDDTSLASWTLTSGALLAVHPGAAHVGSSGLEIDNSNSGQITRTFPNLQPRTISFWLRGQATLIVNSATTYDIAIQSYGGQIVDRARHVLRTDTNKWHFIELRNIDWTQHTYDYYVDEQLLLSGATFNGSGNSVTNLMLANDGLTYYLLPAWLDDIVMK